MADHLQRYFFQSAPPGRRSPQHLPDDEYLTGTDPGLAALHDLALLTGMYGMFMGVLQAFALVRTENIPATEFSELLVPWISAMLSSAPELAKAIDSGQHLTDVPSLAVSQTAFPNLLDTFRDQGVSTELFEPLQAIMDRAIDEGHAADGASRIADLQDTVGLLDRLPGGR